VRKQQPQQPQQPRRVQLRLLHEVLAI
jgi:hypothetical protein